MHNIHRRRWLATAGGLALGTLAPTWVQADDYPSKPITLVCGYPPGGSTDLTARTVAAELTRHLGAR